jgi:fumarate hydratase class II
MGNDATIAIACRDSIFELNVMMPVMAHNLLESVRLLSSGTDTFTARCVEGIEADAERAGEMVEKSLAMCTSLAPLIGYDKAAAIAKKAYATGRTVREVAREESGLSEKELAKALDPQGMTEPH